MNKATQLKNKAEEVGIDELYKAVLNCIIISASFGFKEHLFENRTIRVGHILMPLSSEVLIKLKDEGFDIEVVKLPTTKSSFWGKKKTQEYLSVSWK